MPLKRPNKSRKPLTNHIVRKYECFKCKKQGAFQWTICCYRGFLVVLCLECDILLNRLVADFLNLPQAKVERYAKEMRKLHKQFNRDYPLKRSK